MHSLGVLCGADQLEGLVEGGDGQGHEDGYYGVFCCGVVYVDDGVVEFRECSGNGC